MPHAYPQTDRVLTMRRVFAAAALASFVGLTPAHAAVIGFDVDTNNNPIATGTVIDNTYASLGVTLSSITSCPTCQNSTAGNAYAIANAFTNSAPNAFGIFQTGLPLFDNRWGVGVVKFSTLQQDVGIYGAAVPFVENLQPNKPRPYLTAYDSNHNFLGAAYYGLADGDAGYGSFQKIIFHSASANIAEIHFGSEQPAQYLNSGIVYGMFDDLAFGNDVSDSQSQWNLLIAKVGPGRSNGPDSVPEPASLALVAAGFIAAGFTKRRK